MILLAFVATTFAAMPMLAAEKTIEGKSKQVELQLPEGWAQEESSNKDAELLAHHEGKDCYVLVIIDDKADIDGGLKKYAERRRDAIAANNESSKKGEAKEVKVNGMPAIQYEIQGVRPSGLKLHYLLTVVETDRFYAQVMGWSTESKFEGAKAALAEAPQGLREKPKAK
jgi:hypothetical protein